MIEGKTLLTQWQFTNVRCLFCNYAISPHLRVLCSNDPITAVRGVNRKMGRYNNTSRKIWHKMPKIGSKFSRSSENTFQPKKCKRAGTSEFLWRTDTIRETSVGARGYCMFSQNIPFIERIMSHLLHFLRFAPGNLDWISIAVHLFYTRWNLVSVVPNSLFVFFPPSYVSLFAYC